MTDIYGPVICGKSFREMQRFVSHANKLGETPLLFGGWAVHYYNPYAGSKDVDFAVTDKNFEPLYDFLVENGYSIKGSRLFKDEIFFDLYEQSGEIAPNAPALHLLYRDSQQLYLRRYASIPASGQVLIPTKPMLLFFKLHALANRNVPKDRNDVIALLLKTNNEEIMQLTRLGLSTQLKARLSSIRNDEQNLAVVTKPTKKNMVLLNSKIKELTGNLRVA